VESRKKTWVISSFPINTKEKNDVDGIYRDKKLQSDFIDKIRHFCNSG
jgi:hypothetical protein